MPSRPVLLPTHQIGASRRVRPGAEDPVRGCDAQGESVDQRIQRVAVLEEDLPPDRRDPHAVPVVGDPGDRPGEECPVLGDVQGTETQRVHQRHRPGAHREDVPQDAAHSGGGALERLDEGGVVVRLHLEDGGEPVADVHRAGVLPRSLDDAGRLGGKAGEMAA